MSKRAFNAVASASIVTLLAFGCDGERTVYVYVNGGGSADIAAGASANGGAGVAGTASSGTGGASGTNAGGASGAGGVASGGSAGSENQAGTAPFGGEVTAGGSPIDSGGAPGSAGEVGNGGALNPGGAGGAADAGAGGALCGTLIPDVPANCHATIACQGTHVVDQSNAPTPSNACLLGTCNKAGTPGTAPAPAGTACSAAGGAIVCDGTGKCVRCMKTSDCGGGQVCSASHVCEAGACTDVDCGGTCPACPIGKKCLADADCQSFACDVSSHTCVTPQCQDHHQDGVETDADCGGDVCVPCGLDKGCLVNSDCASKACQAYSLVCVSNTCQDAHIDGFETDVDCGGGGCGACGVGQKCKTNFDCQSGHFCNNNKVCQ